MRISFGTLARARASSLGSTNEPLIRAATVASGTCVTAALVSLGSAVLPGADSSQHSSSSSSPGERGCTNPAWLIRLARRSSRDACSTSEPAAEIASSNSSSVAYSLASRLSTTNRWVLRVSSNCRTISRPVRAVERQCTARRSSPGT